MEIEGVLKTAADEVDVLALAGQMSYLELAELRSQESAVLMRKLEV